MARVFWVLLVVLSCLAPYEVAASQMGAIIDAKPLVSENARIFPGEGRIVYSYGNNLSEGPGTYLLFPAGSLLYSVEINLSLLVPVGQGVKDAFHMFGRNFTAYAASPDELVLYSQDAYAAQEEFSTWTYPLDKDIVVDVVDVIDSANAVLKDHKGREIDAEAGGSYNVSRGKVLMLTEAFDGDLLSGEQDYVKFYISSYNLRIKDGKVWFNNQKTHILADIDYVAVPHSLQKEKTGDLGDPGDQPLMKIGRITLYLKSADDLMIAPEQKLSDAYNRSADTFNWSLDYFFNAAGKRGEAENYSYENITFIQDGNSLSVSYADSSFPLLFWDDKVKAGSPANPLALKEGIVENNTMLILDGERMVVFGGCSEGRPVDDKAMPLECEGCNLSCAQSGSVAFLRVDSFGLEPGVLRLGKCSLNISAEGGKGRLEFHEPDGNMISLDFLKYYGISSLSQMPESKKQKSGSSGIFSLAAGEEPQQGAGNDFLIRSGREKTGITRYGSFVAYMGNTVRVEVPDRMVEYNISLLDSSRDSAPYEESCGDNCYMCTGKEECTGSSFPHGCLWSSGRCFALDPEKYKTLPKKKKKPEPAEEQEQKALRNDSSGRDKEEKSRRGPVDLTFTSMLLNFFLIVLGIIAFVVVVEFFIIALIRKRQKKRSADKLAELKESLGIDDSAQDKQGEADKKGMGSNEGEKYPLEKDPSEDKEKG